MRFSLATAIAIFNATLAVADFNIDLFSDTGCQNKIGTFTGPEGDGAETAGTYDYTGHLGAVIINHLGQWNTQLGTNNGCIATGIQCCNFAPDCRDGVNLAEGTGCYVIDQDVTSVDMSFTVCDTVCIEPPGKRAEKIFGGH